LGLPGGLRGRRDDYTGSKATAARFDIPQGGPNRVARPTEYSSRSPDPTHNVELLDVAPVMQSPRSAVATCAQIGDRCCERPNPTTILSGASGVVDGAGTANRRCAVAAIDWSSVAGRGRRNRTIPGGAGRDLRDAEPTGRDLGANRTWRLRNAGI